MNNPPDLTDATTYAVASQPNAVDRWHVQPDMTVIYERRPGEYEEARVLTASTLRGSPCGSRCHPAAASPEEPRDAVRDLGTRVRLRGRSAPRSG